MNIDYTTLNGLKIRYAVSPGTDGLGADDNPPLLVCNGIGQSVETLESFADALPDRTVILYDAPSAGRSEVPLLPLTIRQHSRIAMELLDELGYLEADVMGLSWGGCVAQQIARSYPKRCRKLVLALTFAGGLAFVPGAMHLMLEMIFPSRYMSRWHKQVMLPMLYGGDALRDPAQLFEHSKCNQRPSLYGYFLQAWSVRFWTSIHWLPSLRQQTLVLSGEQDPLVVPLNQKILAWLIPKAELRFYDCGHHAVVSREQQITGDIEAFLNA